MNVANPDRIAAAFALQKEGVERRRLDFGLAERRAAPASLRETILRREADIVAALAADFGKRRRDAVQPRQHGKISGLGRRALESIMSGWFLRRFSRRVERRN